MLIGSALPLPMLIHSMVSVISWDPSPVPARQFLFSTAPGTKQSSFNVKLVAEILSVMYVPKSQGPSEFQTFAKMVYQCLSKSLEFPYPNLSHPLPARRMW